MDVEEFRTRGKEMIDYICSYVNTLEDRRVTPNVEPGYLRPLLPSNAPQMGEDWESIMRDVEEKIMPGVTHWRHPKFHAYFPSGCSFPSILGDMLSDAIACIGFSWAASPACTELETIVLDWFGKAIGLPSPFIASSKGSIGGGVLQTSASECVLVSMLAARNQAINYLQQETDNITAPPSTFLPHLVAYCSQEAHSCVEKAAKILLVSLRILETDENGSLRGDTLQTAMALDRDQGLLPFLVVATLGSTASCSFDPLTELGPICRTEPCVWLHVDAAYAGSSFICPELKPMLDGIEYVDSFNTNPNKWLLVNFDCSCLWVRNTFSLTSALAVDPLYLQHGNEDTTTDYRHWSIPLSRRFRSLKLWFVLRSYGITGLQAYIRNHIRLAKYFERLVRADDRFEVMNEVRLGLVCFRLNGTDQLNQELLAAINASGKLHMVPSMVRNKYVIRWCITHENACENDVYESWRLICQQTTALLIKTMPISNVCRQMTRQNSRRFSFVRTVSKIMYQRKLSKTNLCDGATPIFIADDDDDNNYVDEEDKNDTNEQMEDTEELSNETSPKAQNCGNANNNEEQSDLFPKEFNKVLRHNSNNEIICNGAS